MLTTKFVATTDFLVIDSPVVVLERKYEVVHDPSSGF